MNVYRDLDKLPEFKNAVVTIGSYDGVHSGHQEILRRINRRAAQCNGESVLITFHPHPRLVVNPDDDSLRLITVLEEKINLLRQYKVNHLVVVPFTKAFSQQTPDEYIRNFLVSKIHPDKILIGYDHRFGNKRTGNIEYLKKFENELGYKVEEIEKQEVDDIVVSSTKIRKSIEAGEIKAATALLNHPFTLSGKVVRGKQRGSQIGFPTANVKPASKHKIIPADGVYAAKVHYKNEVLKSMLYIGRSLDNQSKTVEVNIFDFNQDIYEEELTVEFIARTRGDLRFEGMEELKRQLAKDKEVVTELLS